MYVNGAGRYPLMGIQETDYLCFYRSVSPGGDPYTASETALIAPPGRLNVAQGNALGLAMPPCPKALKGRFNRMVGR
jgi:hypothetical protein